MILRLILAYALVFSPVAHALGPVDKGDKSTYQPGSRVFKNFVKNPDCSLNTSGVTASGGSLIREDSTEKIRNGTSCGWNSSASGQTLKFATNTFDNDTGMFGKTCEAYFDYTGDGDSFVAYVETSGGTQLTADQTLQQGTSGQTIPFIAAYPCSSGANIVVESTVSNPDWFYAGAVEYGISKNIGTVQPATYNGGMTNAGNSSCAYLENTSTGTSDFDPLGTGSSCAAWVVNATGIANGLSAVGTNDHRLAMSTITPGDTYKFEILGTVFANGAGSCLFRLSNGTDSTTVNAKGQASGDERMGSLHFTVVPTITSGTWVIEAADDGPSCGFRNDANFSLAWHVYQYPAKNRQAIHMNQSNYGWTAYTPTLAGFGTATNVNFLHRRDGENIEILGYFTAGTVAASTASFTLPNSLLVSSKVTVLRIVGTGTASAVAANDFGTKTVLANGGVNTVNFGSNNATASASITAQLGNALTSTGATMGFYASIPIQGWVENQGATVVGGVTSGYNGVVKVDSAYLNCAASSAITSDPSDMISTIGNISSGNCAVTLTTGWCSTTPFCSASWDGDGDGTNPRAKATSATAVTFGALVHTGANATTLTGILTCRCYR